MQCICISKAITVLIYEYMQHILFKITQLLARCVHGGTVHNYCTSVQVLVNYNRFVIGTRSLVSFSSCSLGSTHCMLPVRRVRLKL